MPDEVQVRGASEKEMEVIASTPDTRVFNGEAENEEIYDLERVEDAHEFRVYYDMLKGVYWGIIERDL